MTASPLSGITSVASVLRRVVFPAPLGPRSATTSPSSRAKLTPLRASVGESVGRRRPRSKSTRRRRGRNVLTSSLHQRATMNLQANRTTDGNKGSSGGSLLGSQEAKPSRPDPFDSILAAG